jgi:hypothetical protein
MIPDGGAGMDDHDMKRLDKIEITSSKEKFEFRLWLDGQRQPVEFEMPPLRNAACFGGSLRKLTHVRAAFSWRTLERSCAP